MYRIIFIVIALFLIILAVSNCKVTENFADTTVPITSANIDEYVYKVYKADVKAIQNLADIAMKLQAGGVTVPGNMTIQNKLEVDDATMLKNILEVTGATTLDDSLTVNKDTNIKGNLVVNGSLTVDNDLTVSNNLTVKGDIILSGATSKIKFPNGAFITYYTAKDNSGNPLSGIQIVNQDDISQTGGQSQILSAGPARPPMDLLRRTKYSA